MISYRFVPISSQKGVLFLRHPVFVSSLYLHALIFYKYFPENRTSEKFKKS